MKCNVGKTDKIIRIIAGLAIIAAGIYFQSWFGLIGIVPIVTALMGRCLLYYPLDISTLKNFKG